MAEDDEFTPPKSVVADLEEPIVNWLEQVSGLSKGDLEFGDWLEDGQVLCHTMNAIVPGTIKKINASKMPFKQMENISNFTKAARALGVMEKDLFCTVDLAEQKDLVVVQRAIMNLGAVVQTQCPDFTGPKLGKAQKAKVKKESVRPSVAVGDVMSSGLRRDVENDTRERGSKCWQNKTGEAKQA